MSAGNDDLAEIHRMVDQMVDQLTACVPDDMSRTQTVALAVAMYMKGAMKEAESPVFSECWDDGSESLPAVPVQELIAGLMAKAGVL